MFDETDDTWISSLLNDSVEFEEKIEDLRIEKIEEEQRSVTDTRIIPEDLPINIEEVQIKNNLKTKKAVTFGVFLI